MAEVNQLPKVSVVIITYLPKAKKYLDALIYSLKNIDYPKDQLDIVIATCESYQPQYPGVKTVVVPAKEPFPSTLSVNYGVSQTDPSSKYILLLNDDVIMTKDSLLHLVHTVGDNPLVATGISPCQDQLDHVLTYDFVVDGNRYTVAGGHMRLDGEFEKHIPAFCRAKSAYPFGLYFVDHICMFGVLIPRSIWNLVGTFDEKLQGGPDDIDYSWRCRDKGIRLAVLLHAVIWHFGSVSIEDTTLKDGKIQYENWTYFREKHGRYPPYVNQARVDDAKKRGGIE